MSPRRRWLLPCACVAMAAGVLLGRMAPLWWPCALAAAAAGAACLLLRGWGRFAAAMALSLCVGMTSAQLAYHAPLLPEGTCRISGVVAEEIRVSDEGQVRTVLRSATVDGVPVNGAYWTFYLASGETLPEGLEPGRRVTLTAEVYHPGGLDNPGGYDFREYLLQRNIHYGVYGCEDLQVDGVPADLYAWAAAARWSLTGRLQQIMGESSGSYAATMLLGCRSLLPQDDRDAFAALGVAHLLSVSGFHVGVLAGALEMLWRWLRRTRGQRLALNAAVLLLYSLLTGFNAPVVRAMIMHLMWKTGRLCLRQRSALHILSAAWLVMLTFAPAQLMNPGFQMSFGAMLGLTLIAPWLQGLVKPRRGWARVWRLFCAGVGAQLGVMWPQLYWYHELPVIGIVANVALMLFAGVVLTLCWITMALLPFAPLAEAVGAVTSWMIGTMVGWVRAGHDTVGMMLWTRQAGLVTALGFCMLLPALSAWWTLGERRRAVAVILGTALVMVSLTPMPHRGTEYIQLSVGSADAAILHDDDFVMLVDTGSEGGETAAWLHQRRLGVDALVLTHLHRDHAQGVEALLEADIPVRRCYVPAGAALGDVDAAMLRLLDDLRAAGTEIITLSRGDVLTLPSGSAVVLWPESGRVRSGQNANDYSMALRLRLHGVTILAMGDMSGLYSGYALSPADVVKLAHHGAYNDTTDEFLQAASPRMLILSTGQDKRSATVAERFPQYPVYDTNLQGAVTLRIDDDGFSVHTAR